MNDVRVSLDMHNITLIRPILYLDILFEALPIFLIFILEQKYFVGRVYHQLFLCGTVSV